MPTIKIKTKLVNFLKVNNALDEFITAAREDENFAIAGNHVYDTINTAFSWRQTKNGPKYWSELSKKNNEP